MNSRDIDSPEVPPSDGTAGAALDRKKPPFVLGNMVLSLRLGLQRGAWFLTPLCIGAGIYLLVLFGGDGLLKDPDTLWHIKVGQWILDHHELPYTDIYSFTRLGQPWISTAWLSQVLF
ncbi:MAG: hypothetical protein FWD73_08475, partial [Polyangiaceae bacterium]|nr:hypothetical protein [Polyangiaceae bacterium]